MPRAYAPSGVDPERTVGELRVWVLALCAARDRDPPPGHLGLQGAPVALLVEHADQEPVREAEQPLDELAAAGRRDVVQAAPDDVEALRRRPLGHVADPD